MYIKVSRPSSSIANNTKYLDCLTISVKKFPSLLCFGLRRKLHCGGDFFAGLAAERGRGMRSASKVGACSKAKAHFRCRRLNAYGISGFRGFWSPNFHQSNGRCKWGFLRNWWGSNPRNIQLKKGAKFQAPILCVDQAAMNSQLMAMWRMLTLCGILRKQKQQCSQVVLALRERWAGGTIRRYPGSCSETGHLL